MTADDDGAVRARHDHLTHGHGPALAAASAAASSSGRTGWRAVLTGGVRNVAVVFSGTAVTSALGIATAFVLVRHLAPAEYGIFSVLDMIVGVSAGLLTAGINWSLIQSVAARRDDRGEASYFARRVLEIELAYGLAVALGLLLGADYIARRLLHHPELIIYVRLCSVGVVGSVLFEYRRAFLQALRRFRLDASFSVIQSAVYLLVVVVLLGVGALRIRLLAVAYVAVPLIVSLTAIALIREQLTVGRRESRIDFLRRMAPAYGWLLCYTISLWIIGQVHILTLTRYFPLEDVGVYGFSNKVYVVALMAMNAVKVVALPTFAALPERAALRAAYNRALRGTTRASILWWGSLPFIGLFVHFFAGGRYAGATVIIEIFMVGAAISTMLSPATQVLIALEKFGALATVGIASVLLNIAGHLLVTVRYGGVGAAAVQVSTNLVINGACAVLARRDLRLEPLGG
jgi:O-antigen/teichoic acid export membrane protein